MTQEERKAYKVSIEQVAMPFGFKFTGHGCMCTGGQLVYDSYIGRSHFRLGVWDARGYWHLYENNTKIGFGTEPTYLQSELQKLWDLLN